METIGERLKRRREELGLSIEQAAEATKFRPEMIEAVEEGRAGVFSAGVYRDGFIRTYAGLLKLDGDSLLRDEKSEEERAHEAIRGIKLRPQRRSVSPKILIGILTVAVIGIVAAILISRAGRDGETAEDQSGGAQLREVTSAAGSRAKPAGQARRRGRGTASKDSLAGAVAKDSMSAAATESLAAGQAPPIAEGASSAQSGQVGQAAVTPSGSIGEVARQPQLAAPDVRAAEERAAQERATQQRAAEHPTQTGDQTRPAQGAGPVQPGAGSAQTGTPPVQTAAAPSASVRETAAGTHTLAIVASRSANFTIKSGNRIILDDYWLKRGARVVRTDTGPFFIVSLSDRQGVSMTLDGTPVRLPLSDSPELFDWQIPSNP